MKKGNMKKRLSALALASTMAFSMSGCKDKDHFSKEEIEDLANNIPILEEQINNIENELKQANNSLGTLNLYNTELTKKEEQLDKNITDLNEQKKGLDDNISNLLIINPNPSSLSHIKQEDLYSGKYSEIGKEWQLENGDIMRWVKSPQKATDNIIGSGLYNVTQKKEVIPCNKYEVISKPLLLTNGDVVVGIGEDGILEETDGDIVYYTYYTGVYNITQGKEVISCQKYIEIGNEIEISSGDVIRFVQNESNLWGIFSITKAEEIVPCNYISIKESQENDDYAFVGEQEDGTWVNLIHLNNNIFKKL